MDPDKRMDATAALHHPFITDLAKLPSADAPLPERIIEGIKRFRFQCRLQVTNFYCLHCFDCQYDIRW
jgi:hypothetical protein